MLMYFNKTDGIIELAEGLEKNTKGFNIDIFWMIIPSSNQ